MDPTHVTSRKNPLVVRFRAVAHGDADALLLVGPHLLSEAIDANLRIDGVLVAADLSQDCEALQLADRLARAGVPVATGSASVMSAVSPLRSPATIVATADRPRPNRAAVYGGRAPLVVLACGVQDPGNLGTIVRAAEAAGATGLVAVAPCADPYGWKALRGSMGSALRLPIASATDGAVAVRDARRHGCRVIGAVPRTGTRYVDLDMTCSIAIAVGSEGQGLPDAVLRDLDDRVSIPMASPVESLNTAVTAALLLYEAARQRTR